MRESEGNVSGSDVVVIGGGIIGAASAFYLAREGLSVTLVERREALGQLTTLASAASFRAQFTDATNIALMRASIDVFERFGQVIGRPNYDSGLRQQGYLFVSDRPADSAVLRERVRVQRNLGLDDVEYLEGEVIRSRFPYLVPSITGGAYRARDGWLDAVAVARGFAEASGATLLLRTTATGVYTAGGAVRGVYTSRGLIPCVAAVIAAGPFSGALAASLGINLPFTLLTRQTLWINPRPEIPATAPMTIDATTGAHWRPRPDGGALVAWSRPAQPSPPRDPVPIDATFARAAVRAVGRLSPFWREIEHHLDSSAFELRAGQYTITPDHNPLVGPIEAIRGLFVNAGYSGHGVMASPGGAQLLARLVAGREPPGRNPYGPARFRDGVPVDAGEGLVL